MENQSDERINIDNVFAVARVSVYFFFEKNKNYEKKSQTQGLKRMPTFNSFPSFGVFFFFRVGMYISVRNKCESLTFS